MKSRANWIRAAFIAGAELGRDLASEPESDFATSVDASQRSWEHAIRSAAAQRGILEHKKKRGSLGPGLTPQRIDAYRRVLELREAGLSYSAIASEMNADRVPTPRGGPWGVSSVQAILQSDAAATLRATDS